MNQAQNSPQLNIVTCDDANRLAYAGVVNGIQHCASCELADKGGYRDIGEGFVPAPLMVVAESFGAVERKEGRPLIGDAGQIWREVMAKHGLNTSGEPLIKTFLTNTIACWPPPPAESRSFNGKPTAHAISECKKHLWGKIRLVRPQVICTLGDIATRNLLSIASDDTSFRMRDQIGTTHDKKWAISGKEYRVKIVPAYHPSYVLRNGRDENLLVLYDRVVELIKGLLV